MIDSIRLIQTGDLHLGSPFSFAPELAGRLQQSQLETFWSIIRLCQEQQADVLLIAGDLFDQPVH
jgi:exonuclease SbcD